MSQPTKEQLREWQEKNRRERRPPASPADAQRELGWDLIKGQRKNNKRTPK